MKKIAEVLKHPLFNLLLFVMWAVILFLLLAGYTNFSFNFGSGQFSASKDNNKNKIIEYVTETAAIEMYKRASEQRQYMDDKVNQMIRIILAHHVKLLQKCGITEDYFSHPQYKAYSHIVELALREMKDNSERRFIYMNEHFDETKKEEFKQFTKVTATEFIGSVSKIVQDEWINLGITKEDNYEWTRQLIPEIVSMIVDVYEYAFAVQIKYSKRIQELKKALSEIGGV